MRWTRILELPALTHGGGTLALTLTVEELVAVHRAHAWRITNIAFKTHGWPIPYKVEFWHGGAFLAALSPLVESWGTSMRVAAGAHLAISASIQSAEPISLDLIWEPLDDSRGGE